jgi:hypothetical protein
MGTSRYILLATLVQIGGSHFTTIGSQGTLSPLEVGGGGSGIHEGGMVLATFKNAGTALLGNHGPGTTATIRVKRIGQYAYLVSVPGQYAY